MSLPNCPECQSDLVYEYAGMYVCPVCAHEWNPLTQEESEHVFDCNRNPLLDGDQGIFAKDVKIKGSSESIKQGTKVQNIRIESNGAHNIVAKVAGFGWMELKSQLIKKV